MTGRRVGSHSLSPERWKALEPLVDAALALPPAGRPEFFERASAGDAQLRAELESMVAECERPDTSLDLTAPERFGSLLETSTPTQTTALLAGRFRIERELGRGGMSTVYLAHDLKHERDVALKMVHPELAELLGGKRFVAEIRVTATLRHPNILPLFDSGEADGCIYFVMPFVDGGTLRDRLARERTLPRAEALRIASQVADGLASAHRQGIIHCDIKPENILLAADGRHAYVADFGIALALTRTDDMVRNTGELRFGTPAYMSPEQFEASPEIDARTDVYSLGCVLHEMLTGSPPAWGASTLASPEPSAPTRWRKGVKPASDVTLERVVTRALAVSPTDRFLSAEEFAQALAGVARSDAEAASNRVRRWSAGAVVAAGVLGLLVAVSPNLVARIRGNGGPAVDPDLIVVLPFRADTGAQAILSGENTARLLYDALGRWTDLKLGDEIAAVEAGRRGGAGLTSVRDAVRVARELGAGRFVWGEVTDQGGTARISAQLYDSRKPTRPVAHVVNISASDGAAAKIEEVADSLVAKLVGTPAAGVGTNGTRSFAALKRYAEGYAALHEWNTQLAELIFRSAVDLDPRFAQAWLGLAQSMAWGGRRAPEWQDAASRALADSSALSARDRLLAKGLLALSEWRMADACAVYRALVARDPRDFAAHFGLGDCLSMDRLVVPDRRSPTGWRFRGSLHTAIEEYQRALALAPSYLDGSRGQTFARLTDRILFDESGDFRRGFAIARDTIWMSAFPEIDHDTLAFFPRYRDAFVAAGDPPTHREAVARNRQLLRTLTARWVSGFPNSAAAWEHHAGALESLGILGTLDEAQRGAGALGAIGKARQIGGADGVDSVRQATTHARVLIKLRQFAEARTVADSALADRRTPTAAEATLLAPLAALTGRARLTAQLFAVSAADPATEMFSDLRGGERQLPAAVLSAAGSYGGFAAMGAPADSLRVTRARVDRMIREWVPATDRDIVRAAVFFPADFQAQPALGTSVLIPVTAPRQRLLAPWQHVARGDTAAARRLVARDWQRLTSPDVTAAPDISLQFALLALALGDTATAAAVLDRVVTSIPDLASRLTTEVFPAAALPRALQLRASLARPGSTEAAAVWASAKDLWLHADPELRATSDSAVNRNAASTSSGRQKASKNSLH